MNETIIIAVHDPGGYNVVLPVIEALSRNKVIILALGPARDRLPAELLELAPHLDSKPVLGFPRERLVDSVLISNIFDRYCPILVFSGTSYQSNLEWLCIREAKRRKISSAVILDYWAEYRTRFVRDAELVLPDQIFVNDERMRTGILGELGDAAPRVELAGNPHLERIARTISNRKQVSELPKNEYRFISENIYGYFPEREVNEFVLVERILTFLTENLDGFTFKIRPHPMEDPRAWSPHIVRLQDQFRRGRIELETCGFEEALENPAVAVGISSMALLETACCGHPTVSFQIGIENRDEYFFIPFTEYGIHELREESDMHLLLRPKSEDSDSGPKRESKSISTILKGLSDLSGLNLIQEFHSDSEDGGA